jgi:hypothetical protein
MSLRDVSSPKPLLAKKGGAAPINPGALRADPREPSLRTVESDRDNPLESAPVNVTAGIEEKAVEKKTGKQTADAVPAASLLPFNLLRNKYRPEETPDLAEDERDMVPADLVASPEPEPEPKPKQQAELFLRSEPKPDASIEPRAPLVAKPEPELKIPRPPEPEAEARLESPAPAPAPDPEWRVGIDAPVQPERTSGGGWLLPFGALAAAFVVLVVGWKIANPDFDVGFWPAPEAVKVGETAGDVAEPIAVEPPPPIAASPESTAAVVPEPAAPAPLEASLPKPVLSPPAEGGSEAGAAPVDLAVDKMPPAPAAGETQAAVTPTESITPETVTSETATPASAVAGTAEETKIAPAPESDPAAGGQQTTAVAVPTPVKPTVDVVRLEASGEAVIAGRAEPNSELIVLDNGKPIGTVKADKFGEWVFVPEVALPTGDHEFGLVVKTVQESVNLPAPNKLSLPPAPAPEPTLKAPEPAPVAPSDAAPDSGSDTAAPDDEASRAPDVAPIAGADGTAPPIPVPLRKPEPEDSAAIPAQDQAAALGTPAASTADFVVQLASVKTRAGAEQEWRKLKQRFPEILLDMVPALDEVKLVDHGTVIRVRTGAFDSQRDAASLCAQFEAKSQACLVVKVSGSN